MSDTPIYDVLVAELGDPEQLARGVDEDVILWHADRQRRTAGGRHAATPARDEHGRFVRAQSVP